MPASGAAERTARDLERVIFFSDAVMAIAITLLILELQLPDLGPQPTDETLRTALAGLLPSVFSVVVSFAVIALWWTTHHRLFSSIARLDGWLMVLNLAFLGAIAFLPFPTAVLGRTTLPSAIALYAATNATVGYLMVVMRERARRAHLLTLDVAPDAFQRRTLRSLIAPTVFAITIPLGYVIGALAAWTWNLIWILTIVLRRWRGPSGPY